jgi:peptidoglycan/xylan/chitin deacetylase (PgdA/CDA1 family)
MKRAARLVLTHPVLVRAAFSLTRRVAPIFMLHRFREAEGATEGHDPDLLRANLSWLRKNKCSLLSLSELVDRLDEGAPLNRAVAFTVDDGYADFARVAAPIFAEFDCPVTVFLTTGFLDGNHWMWWDRLTVALAALGRDAELWPMIEDLKRVPESEKLERINRLVQESGLSLPDSPPPRFAPLGWNDVRRLARNGVTFGPHTITHPVLSRTSDEQSRFEIEKSWRRIQTEAADGAVPIFCYPNGERADFTERESNVLAEIGMRAAVSTSTGYASYHDFSADHFSDRFRLPRFSYSENPLALIQVASGIERAKLAVRSVFGQGPA